MQAHTQLNSQYTLAQPVAPAFLPTNGQHVRVVEIAPWDTVPNHKVGTRYAAVVVPDSDYSCIRCDENCNDRPVDGTWLLLVTQRGEFLARTLCRVEPA